MPPPKAKLHKSTGRLKNISNSRSSSSSANRENQPTTNSSSSSNNPNTQSRGGGSVRQELPAARTNPTNSTNPTDSPAIEQFELELYWCIQTLENSLSSGKLNAKQVQDAEKTLRSLKSNSQPMVKKRQMMQSAFGDYRKKMADEEKKLRVGNTSIQFVDGTSKDQSTSTNKGHFVKKSFTTTLGNSNFQFNFPIDAMEKLSIENPSSENDGNLSESTSPKTSIDDKANAESSTQNSNECANANKLDAATTHSNPFIQSKLITSDNSFRFNFAVDCD